MNLEAIRDAVTSRTARQVLLGKKHSPKILFVAGAVGVVTSTVLACRATLKMSDVLDEHEKKQRNLVPCSGLDRDIQDQKDYQSDLHRLQIHTGLEIAKLYTPAIAVGIVSIAALTGSHVILSKRNGAVMAAYAGLDKAYKEYRQRVANEYGSDVDRKFATGSEDVVVEEKTADGTTNKHVVQGKGKGRFGGSPYAVVFDEQSKFFSPEPGRNAMTVQMKQNWANDKLKSQGHLTLNEALDLLGLPKTQAGFVVGWVYNPEDENHTGDNYVDFGIFTGEKEYVEAFIDGDEKYAVLDFNVDGIIYDKI